MARPRVFRTEAIVLRSSDFGEADRLIVLLTAAFGKIRAVAKGVRRRASRRAGHLMPFTWTDVLLARGRELDVITQAEVRDAFPGIHEQLAKTVYAYLMAELCDRLVEEPAEGRAAYRLFLAALRALEVGGDPRLVASHFALHLLTEAGYQAELSRCVKCLCVLSAPEAGFSPRFGGTLCTDCLRGDSSAEQIPPLELQLMRRLQAASLADQEAPACPSEVSARLLVRLESYVEWLLGGPLRSPRVIRRLELVSPATPW